MTDLRTYDEDAAGRFDERERARAENEARWFERVCEVDRTLTPRERGQVDAAVAQGRDRHEVLRAVWQIRQDRGDRRARQVAQDELETPEAEKAKWDAAFAAGAKREEVHYAADRVWPVGEAS